jgi:Kef-type K+ transport system membrane component KefB
MVLPHSLQFLLAFSIILLFAKGLGMLFQRLGLPFLTGEIAAGIILGPTLINLMAWDVLVRPDPTSLTATITDLAEIGMLLLLFLAGLETDAKQLRAVGKTSIWGASGGVALPLVGGIVLGLAFGFPLITACFIGAILTATSVTITAGVLREHKLQNTRAGTAIMGAAIIDDVLGILVLSFLTTFSGGGSLLEAALFPFVRVIVWLVLFYLLGHFIFPRLFKFVYEVPQEGIVLSVALVVMFFYAVTAELGGRVATITGAYLAGFLLGKTPYKDLIIKGIHPLTYSFFLPLFFATIGFRVNLLDMDPALWLFPTILIVWAVISKVAGAGLGAMISGFKRRDALRLGCSMVGRGEVGFVIGSYAIAVGLINEEIFAGGILMVFVTTLIAPSLMAWSFRERKEKEKKDDKEKDQADTQTA